MIIADTLIADSLAHVSRLAHSIAAPASTAAPTISTPDGWVTFATVLTAIAVACQAGVAYYQAKISKAQTELSAQEARIMQGQQEVERQNFRLGAFAVRNQVYVATQEWIAMVLSTATLHPHQVSTLLSATKEVDHLFPAEVRDFIQKRLYHAGLRLMKASGDYATAAAHSNAKVQTAANLRDATIEVSGMHAEALKIFGKYMQLGDV